MASKNIRVLTRLAQHRLIKTTEIPQLAAVIEKFSFSITSQMDSLIDKDNPEDPIAKQFIPRIEELAISSEEKADPIGDEHFAPIKGIVHRYPDRCLFIAVHVCPVYCRFCFRREKVGPGSKTLAADELEAAYAYITEHPEIWEVILTGGDPLILNPNKLKAILDRIEAIKHVQVMRIHTRIPVVEPRRINDEMIQALKRDKPVYVVLHANHANEFGLESRQACAKLVNAGLPMLSQSVLLKGINDNIETLSKLMRCFIQNRIKPYYLHQGDLAKGTKHFRTTIKHGQLLIKQLRGRFSGICQPTYILDIPGGHGKVPIGPHYLKQIDMFQDELFSVEDYQGNLHHYSTDASA